MASEHERLAKQIARLEQEKAEALARAEAWKRLYDEIVVAIDAEAPRTRRSSSRSQPRLNGVAPRITPTAAPVRPILRSHLHLPPVQHHEPQARNHRLTKIVTQCQHFDTLKMLVIAFRGRVFSPGLTPDTPANLLTRKDFRPYQHIPEGERCGNVNDYMRV